MNYYSDESEWKWMFKNGIQWDSILPLYFPEFPTEEGFESKEEILEFFEDMLGQIGGWAGSNIADRAETLDREGAGVVTDGKTILGPTLTKTYNEAIELGLHGFALPKKFGGMGLPPTAGAVALTNIGRACNSSLVQLAFFGSVAEMINRFGDEEDKERIIPKIIAGEISGAMCITEPGSGSDVGSMKTSAALQSDGTYLINGSKIFITNGGGGIQLVLAKVKGAPEGLAGISMFLVEQNLENKEGLNYQVVKNEDKMGLHGSFTCEILYENTIGKLMGKENEGFKYMLHLMNAARLACGIQSVGGIENCLAYVRKYAEDRQQFGRNLLELPLFKRNLEDWETERDALRALLVDTFNHFDVHQYYDQKEKETGDLTKEEKETFETAKIWTRKRTPLLKYYATEKFTELSQRSIQALGGYGFMREYPMERLHRDSFAPLLYEGTSQIQALMVLKDLVKYAMKEPSKFMANIFFKHPGRDLLNGTSKWEKDFRSSHYRFKKKMIRLLIKSLNPPKNFKILDPNKWVNEDKISALMIHAETLCQASSYMETLRVLAEHANKESDRSALYFRYSQLVSPRLEGIYKDWSIRNYQ